MSQEAVVDARWRVARKKAKKKGYVPLQAHLPLVAWTLFITHVSKTSGQPSTVLTVYPIRWEVEPIVKSWTRYLDFAAFKPQKRSPDLMLFVASDAHYSPQ